MKKFKICILAIRRLQEISTTETLNFRETVQRLQKTSKDFKRAQSISQNFRELKETPVIAECYLFCHNAFIHVDDKNAFSSLLFLRVNCFFLGIKEEGYNIDWETLNIIRTPHGFNSLRHLSIKTRKRFQFTVSVTDKI